MSWNKIGDYNNMHGATIKNVFCEFVQNMHSSKLNSLCIVVVDQIENTQAGGATVVNK